MSSIRKLIPEFIRTKYLRRLLVLLSIVILAIATIGGVAFIQTGTVLQENTESNLEQSAQLQANTVAEWIQSTENHVETLSTTEEINSGDPSQIEDRLQNEQETMSESVVALHYLDSEFEIQASTADVAGMNLQAEGIEWAESGQIPDDGQTVTVDPYTDPIMGGSMIATVSSASDSDRFVVAIIDLESQSESLVSPSPVDGAFTHVVNSDGAIVMSHHTGQITQQNMGPDDDPGVESMAVMNGLEGDTGYVEMDMDHGLMTMGYAPVEGTDWVLMSHIPADDAFALQDQIGQLMLALLAVSLIGLGTVGVVVGRNTSRSLTKLASKAHELEQGNLETELRSSRDDELGQLYAAFANMRDSLQESLRETEAARTEAEQQRQQLEAFARQLEQEAGEVMALAADGNLTRRIDVEGESPELEQVASEYNEMVDDMEQTIAQLNQFAATVAEHSEEVTASAAEAQSSSENVSRTVQRISERTVTQNEKLQIVSDNINDISTATEEIASLSHQVSDIAEQTARTGEEGQIAVQEAIDAMDSVDQESKETVEEIEILQEEIGQVEEIAGVIADIAKQMNMLALNANIEASRSVTGDEGGFSAVASEVKELSAESKKSAEKIERIAEGVFTQTEQAVEEVQNTRKEITASQETVEQAASAYEEIATYTERTSEGVSEISAATEEQTAATQEVVAMIEEAAELSSDVANEAGEVAAAAEGQTSALTDVTENTKQLSNEANDLQDSLDQFTISSNGDPPTAASVIKTNESSSHSPHAGDSNQSVGK